MMPHSRYAAAAFALVVGAGPALSQTIITEPAAPDVVVTGAPLDLSPAERTVIHRTVAASPLVRERVVTELAEPVVVGARLPPTVALAPLPPAAVIEVPAVRSYRYAYVDGRLLLVDPATNIVVEDLGD
jgi:hypothetical protein